MGLAASRWGWKVWGVDTHSPSWAGSAAGGLPPQHAGLGWRQTVGAALMQSVPYAPLSWPAPTERSTAAQRFPVHKNMTDLEEHKRFHASQHAALNMLHMTLMQSFIMHNACPSLTTS